MHLRSRFRIPAFFAALVLCFAAPTLAAQQPSPVDIWMGTQISGQSAGYYHEKIEDRGGKVLTFAESDIVMNRLETRVEIKSGSHYTESSDGYLLSVSGEMSSSMQSTRMEATVGDGFVIIQMTVGDKSYERSLPFKGTLIGPEGIRQLTLSGLKTAGDSISYQTFSPELGTISTGTRKLLARETVNVEGESIPSLKLEEAISDFPVKTTLWLDEQGRVLRQVSETPFGEMASVRSSAAKVQEATKQGASLGDEVFTRTVIHSNIRLPEERMIEAVTLRITHHHPELGWPDLSADNQRVLEKTSNSLVLEVRRPKPAGAARRPVQASPELKSFLAPNALLQSDDANVRKIAKEVLGDERDLFRAARALQQWTNENMKFDAGIAIASGSEVARDRRGTCFGYSTLLASLMRAAGIPSRVRMGFVYAAGIWGGHAWVEVLDGRSWIPLDGALYTPGPADAARFSVFTSSFEEGTITQVGALAQLFGNVDVQILEYTVAGRRVVVSPDAKPYVTTGDVYENPWLGLSVTKPSSFQFAKLDSAWPDLDVVAMESANGEHVEIENHSATLPTQPTLKNILNEAGIKGTATPTKIAGHPAALVASPDMAAAAVLDGGNIWLVKASGPQASDLLQKVVSTMKFGASQTQFKQGF